MVFSFKPESGREAAMMGSDRAVAQERRQVMSHPLSEPARVDENESRAVLTDQLRQAAIYLRPDFIGHHGFERRAWNFNRQIHYPRVAAINDHAIRLSAFRCRVRASQS